MGEKSGVVKWLQLQYYHFCFLGIVFCFWFSTFIYIPAFSVYLNFLDIGFYSAGLIMGSYGIMQILIRFPLGLLADKFRIGGKAFVVIGFIASIISAILLALWDSFLPIFFGRFFAGITAAMWVVLTIWYGSNFHKKRSLKAMGILQTTMVSSQFISMAISGYIAELFGFISLFWIGGSFAVIGLVLVLLLPSGVLESKQIKREGSLVRMVVKERNLWLLSLLSLLAHAVLFATIFGFSSAYFNQLNGDTAAIIFLVIAFMLPHALAPLVLTRKKSSLGNPYFVLALCFGVGAGALLLMGIAGYWLVYCLLHALLGISLGIVFPILLNQVYLINQGGAAKTVMGFYQSIYSVGIVLGPVIAGYFSRQIDIKAVFTVSFILLMTAAIISIRTGTTHQTQEAVDRIP